MKLCLGTQNVLGVKSGLDPDLCDIVAVVKEASLLDVSQTVFTSDYVLLPLT